jgi:tRNA G18 (ribose-2'-O)-methylase SpoU
MNVIDALKNLSVPDIRNYCSSNTIDASAAMINIEGDFNLSTMVRNANFFGFRNVYYVGKKKWDKRGSVGTHHYTNMFHYDSVETFLNNHLSNSHIIGIENNIPTYSHKTSNLFQYDFSKLLNPVFVFGSENTGLCDRMLSSCDRILTIPNYGSVRSLNVGTTSGIVMGLYRNYIEQSK